MNRRILLLGIVLAGLMPPTDPAFAKDGGNSGNSGSSGSGDGSGGGDDDHGGDDDGDDSWDKAADAAEHGDIATLPSVIKVALANTPGRVLAVKLMHSDNSYLYRIKILANTGRKVELVVDARTRTVLGLK